MSLRAWGGHVYACDSMERRQILRSRVALTILATLLIQVSGAQAVFADAPRMPACCVRAAGHPHCESMSMATELAPPPHRHSGTSFLGTPAKCGCTMGLAAPSLFVSSSNSSIEVASLSVGRPLQEQAIRETAASIYGQRGPPAI